MQRRDTASTRQPNRESHPTQEELSDVVCVLEAVKNEWPVPIGKMLGECGLLQKADDEVH